MTVTRSSSATSFPANARSNSHMIHVLRSQKLFIMLSGGIPYEKLLGYHFEPRDEEAVFHLKNRVWGENTTDGFIQDIDFYSLDPDQLSIKSETRWKTFAYYFTYLHRINADSKPDRSTSDGHWEEIGGDVAIIDNDEIIGYKNTFSFVFVKDSADGKKDNYFMEELRLDPSLSSDDPNIRNNIENLVLCKVVRMPPQYFVVPEVEWVEGANECSDVEDETLE